MGLELLIVVVLTIALFIAVAVTGHGSVSNLTSGGITEGAPNYFAIGGGLMAAMIMGIATLVGFDSAANMAEEAKDPFRSVPRAIVGSVVAAMRKGVGRQEDAFDLGRFEMPVAIAALVWSVIVVFVLVTPPQALTAVLISVGILLAGGVYFAYLFISNREVLDTEPGEADVFTLTKR